MAGVDKVGYSLACVELCFPSLRVADSTGSSPARWFAERIFPLTPALSPRRGRTVRRAFANPERLDLSPRGIRCSLRGGSGRDHPELFARLAPLNRGSWAGNWHPASFLSRVSFPSAACARRFNAETAARPSAFDAPLSGGRFSLCPRGAKARARSGSPRVIVKPPLKHDTSPSGKCGCRVGTIGRRHFASRPGRPRSGRPRPRC